MKNFVIPALAFVSAIGMSFTTANTKEQASDYVLLPNDTWRAFSEVDCGQGEQACQAMVDGNGPFQVYDEQDTDTPKEGSGTLIIVP